MSKRVSFSCEANEFEYQTTSMLNNASQNHVTYNYKKSKVVTVDDCGMYGSPPSRSSSGGLSSAERFVKSVGSKMARALSLVPLGKMTNRSSRKVCNSSYTCSGNSSNDKGNLGRCRSYAEKLDDSHRAEAIQDCIQFFNSSSSSLH